MSLSSRFASRPVLLQRIELTHQFYDSPKLDMSRFFQQLVSDAADSWKEVAYE